MTLPISVVIPHQKSRDRFFRRFCLPSVISNDVAQIIVQEQEGGACEKRNAGAKLATQPFMVMVDDDMIVGADCFRLLLQELQQSSEPVGYAYSDHVTIPWPGTEGHDSRLEKLVSGPFDPAKLRRGNYINTLAVMVRSKFAGFDPAVGRFQDWDLWLSMLKAGVHGVYVPGFLFANVTVDRGITSSEPSTKWMDFIRRKHNLTA